MTNLEQLGGQESVRAWVDRGVAFGSQGRFEDAAVCFRWVLQSQPDCFDAHFYLGVVLEQQGRLHEAAACYGQALQIDSSRLDALNNLGNLGNLHRSRGDLDSAISCYQQLLHFKPDHVAAHYCLGSAFAERGLFNDAAASYQLAIHLEPGHADAHNNLGIALAAMGRLDDAVASYQQAIRENPEYAEAHNNLGVAFDRLGRFDDAMASYGKALRLKPNYADAHSNLGSALMRQGLMDEAISCYQQAICLRPEFARAHNNLGTAFTAKRQLEQAEACYLRAIALDPELVDAHINRALALLLAGSFQEGWVEYEWRCRHVDGDHRFSDVPCWDGEPLQGRAILLHAEQGLGDTVQFVRYAPLVKERGGMVLLECQPPLVQLAATCRGIDETIALGATLPHFDVHAPVMSLPSIFDTRLSTIPVNVPYLAADPSRVEHWRNILALEHGFKVGLVWQGSRVHAADAFRSIALGQFAPLAEVPGVALFGLQVGTGSEQIASAGLPIIDLGSLFDPASLADLAAVLVNLDLLITADTAPAHLAGALGVPVWLALPLVSDWRWLLDCANSPWYPSARLFRQHEAGNWHTVFKQMALVLKGLAGQGT
jgi:tetratricopeptide (TPR) repeat protein